MHGRLTLAGELDIATRPALSEAATALANASSPQITVDLGGLEFIDAAGLGGIVALRATLIAAGKQVRLNRVSARIRRTFAVAGLAGLL